MELEKLNSSKFEKFKANEIIELTGSIRGGRTDTCDKNNNDDCLWIDETGLNKSDITTGQCSSNSQDKYPSMAIPPFLPVQFMQLSPNISPNIGVINTNVINKIKRF